MKYEEWLLTREPSTQTCLTDVIATKKATMQERSYKRISLMGSKAGFRKVGSQVEIARKHRALQWGLNTRYTLEKTFYKGIEARSQKPVLSGVLKARHDCRKSRI